ncbi:anti sigma factor C-terminal domain-containing protein [Anaerobacillus isosaccharinicus]|uniref:Anti sigma factor C-terminal domain-containing protein n=1 Tax=Anaerobacillus isosaccharinicus TaxID=1532552 RepID=A0A1S2LEE6_9BACI|nr:anti sigma factor C-terminal domain-containing protein [Anaerobacillus isosaccharinicus]MBA5586537.1 anti sigma factor C-terminal domain-containing protein [Anaerobacillus isosaccharinicus]QOY35223.1 anti sigma factor C-terminal domain-containing protein [Anaerobacillus isosaccharinicus]
MDDNKFFANDKQFGDLLKKTKRVSFIKSIFISFIVSLLVFLGLYFLGSYWMQSKIEKESGYDSLWSSVHGANIEERGTIYNYSPLTATAKTELVKTVAGIPIPWGQREKQYTVFGTSKFISAIGPSSVSKLGEDRSFYYFLGQRVIEFYHPKVEYKKIFDDRYVFDNMTEQQMVELALSFDKGYSIAEVNKFFQEHLAWYWLDTLSNDDIKDFSHWNMEEGLFYHDFTVLGTDAFGFPFLEGISAEMFLNTLNELQKDGKYQSSVNGLINTLTENGSLELNEEVLQIVGVVVTGPANELQKYNNVPIVTGATLGAVTNKYQ